MARAPSPAREARALPRGKLQRPRSRSRSPHDPNGIYLNQMRLSSIRDRKNFNRRIDAFDLLRR